MAKDLILHVNYPWQQVVLDALMEFDPERLPIKISTAQRLISERLCQVDAIELNELLGLAEAMRSPPVLRPTNVEVFPQCRTLEPFLGKASFYIKRTLFDFTPVN